MQNFRAIGPLFMEILHFNDLGIKVSSANASSHLGRCRHRGDANTIISLNTSFGDIINPHDLKIRSRSSSNLTKKLPRYICGISLNPMLLIFVELSCLQAKIANFHVEINPHDLEKIGHGHPFSNLTKTLLRYIHGISLGPM